MTPAQSESALVRLRVELFSAAQLLQGEQLEDFKQLIRDVSQVVDLAPPVTATYEDAKEGPVIVGETRAGKLERLLDIARELDIDLSAVMSGAECRDATPSSTSGQSAGQLSRALRRELLDYATRALRNNQTDIATMLIGAYEQLMRAGM